MEALNRLLAASTIALVCIGVTGCSLTTQDTQGGSTSSAVPAPSPSTASEPDSATDAVDDDWVLSMMLMQAAQPEQWLDEWYDNICSSVMVATGDKNCTDRATMGAIMVHGAAAKVEDLLAAGAPVEDLVDIAESGRIAGEEYFGAGCDREPSTDCVGPTDDVVDVLRDYADTVRSIIDEGL